MKKLLSVLSVLLLAILVISGCAPSAAPTEAPAEEVTEAEVEEAAEEPEEAAEAPAEGEPVPIGLSQPLSGAGGTMGQLIRKGFDLAVEEINASGGVLDGQPIAPIWEDNQGDPAEAVAVVEKLIERDEVPLLVCCYQSSATLATQPTIAKSETPTLNWISSNPTITEQGYDWFYRIKPTSYQESGAIADWVVNDLGWNKVAFIAVNNDWGRGEVSAYKEILTGAGAEVVFEEYHQQGESDHYAILTGLKQSGVDGVIMTTDYEQLSNLNKQFVELGIDMGRMLTSGNQPHVVGNLTSPEVVNGMYATTAYLDYSPDDPEAATPENQHFYEAYMEKYPDADPPSFGEAEGYVGAYILADVIERAGSLDQEALVKAFQETNLDTIRGPVRFDENGQMIVTVWVRQYDDGAYNVLFKGTSE
jgi:branched-chain amino acid transport system substrate-binding protein